MANSLNRLFRRLRDAHDASTKRKKSLPADCHVAAQPLSGCCSRKTSSTLSHRKEHPGNRKSSGSSVKWQLLEEQLLPNALLHRIFDALENPFDMFPLRRLNRGTAEYVREKIESVSEMDLRRVNFDTLSTSTSASSTSGQSETTVIINGETWHIHPTGCKVLCRVCPVEEAETTDPTGKPTVRLEVLVDEQWTSREICVLCSLISEFRRVVRRISLDAPIFELIVANLAAVDLDRWFAFQCFIKAVDECQMNAALNKLAAQLQQQQQDEPPSECDGDSLYWPNAKTIVVRTTERESIHLARVLNYGVRSHLMMDRKNLDRLSLQVCVTDANQTQAERPKQLLRNLYHFRCWAGSPGFDERFSQQWRSVNRVA